MRIIDKIDRIANRNAMQYNRDRHHRRSIRLQGHNYSSAGTYHVTICSHQRLHLFGEIVDGQMQLNSIGQIVIAQWQNIPRHFPNVELDEFVLMPNHLHGIIIISDREASEISPNKRAFMQGTQVNSLGAIVQNFKSVTTRKINRIDRGAGTPIWQRNYYEQIIQGDRILDNIRQYIADNPSNWESDRP
jgi:putative transposase